MLPAQSFSRNLIIRNLSADDFQLLQPSLMRVALERGDDLVVAGTDVAFVHFMEGGVVSVVADLEDHAVEVGLIGREGFTGALVLLGATSGPERSFIQIDHSTALRIATADLLAAAARSETLRLTLLRFVQAQAVQAASTAASNVLHALPARLARWLLMCHDRIDGDALALTHEFMAMMLGVRRSGVTVTLHLLEGVNAIEARRGLILVRDRMRLETIAGPAYGTAEAEYRRLLGPFGRSRGDVAFVR